MDKTVSIYKPSKKIAKYHSKFSELMDNELLSFCIKLGSVLVAFLLVLLVINRGFNKDFPASFMFLFK